MMIILILLIISIVGIFFALMALILFLIRSSFPVSFFWKKTRLGDPTIAFVLRSGMFFVCLYTLFFVIIGERNQINFATIITIALISLGAFSVYQWIAEQTNISPVIVIQTKAKHAESGDGIILFVCLLFICLIASMLLSFICFQWYITFIW